MTPNTEDKLVAALAARCATPTDGLAVGIGDDCAVLDRQGGGALLFKTDCVVEGVHFASDCPPALAGRKALCRVLSDIAAMAGQPGPFLVTAGLGGVVDPAWLEAAYKGMGEAARACDAVLAGGETTRSPGAGFLSITMLGSMATNDRPVLRSGGQPGDLIFVTGELGNSLAGRHLTFQPRLAEAAWLAATCRPHAMMDLSDGLAADLPRLAAASGTGCQLNVNALPRCRGATVEAALCDGEDYELLFTVAPDAAASLPDQWQRQFPNLRLTQIGRLTADPHIDVPGHGYDHVSKATGDRQP